MTLLGNTAGDLPQPIKPYTGPADYAFVSYSRADTVTIQAELAILHSLGCRVWYDLGIRPASDWTEELAQAIVRCRLFVVFLTPNAMASEYVRNEIHFALSQGKPILVIHLKPAELPPGLMLQLGRFQAIMRYELPDDPYREQLRLSLPPEILDVSTAPATVSASARPTVAISPATRAAVPLPAFHYGSVVPPDYFIDREEELEEAVRLVRGGHGFILVGNRRAGKTSFCTKLIHEIMGRPANDILAVYLNLQQCARLTPESFLEHTLLNVVGEMARQVFGCKYSDLLRPNPADGNERLRADRDFGAFADLFTRIRERTHTQHDAKTFPLMAGEFVQLAQDLFHILRAKNWRRCVLFYDEANRLPHGLSVDLLESNEEALSAAGVTSVYAASPEMEESFSQIRDVLGRHLRLGPFRSPEDMRRLLVRYYCAEAGGTAELPAEPAALARMWEISVGRPYVIQLLAGGSFRLARKAWSPIVLVGHVNQAYEELRREKPHLFT